MASNGSSTPLLVTQQKPHAIFVPFPTQGHVSPTLQLARLFHWNGFHITFVNTEFNHKRFTKSLGAEFVKGLEDFQFETIPDGLPPSDKDATQEAPLLCGSTQRTCYGPFKELVNKINSTSLPVTCIVADGTCGFAGRVAKDLGILDIRLWTASACGFVAYLQFDELVNRGILPFKDENFMVDGTMDMNLDWITGMKDIRLKDFPTFMRVTDLNDVMFGFLGSEAKNCIKSSIIIINTFEALEDEALNTLRAKNPNIYSIGPLPLLGKHYPEKENGFKASGSSFWKNDPNCIKWLSKWAPSSVLYINYGSITVMTNHELKEFAWGIANTKLPFLWIMRPDVVVGEETSNLPQEFLDEVKDRGYITSWCFQEEVLAHPSVGGFLTHCGWNSTVETVASGVPTICWPFFAEQQTNCRYLCNTWKIGLELNHVKRDEITKVMLETMVGEKGKEMRHKSLELKKKAIDATSLGGSSYNNFLKLIKEVLHHNAL